MNQLFLKPQDGVQVRHPNGKRLADDGETVQDSPYWRRRISDGDVVQGKAPKPPKGGTTQANRE
jgi:hypothetical protein